MQVMVSVHVREHHTGPLDAIKLRGYFFLNLWQELPAVAPETHAGAHRAPFEAPIVTREPREAIQGQNRAAIASRDVEPYGESRMILGQPHRFVERHSPRHETGFREDPPFQGGGDGAVHSRRPAEIIRDHDEPSGTMAHGSLATIQKCTMGRRRLSRGVC